MSAAKVIFIDIDAPTPIYSPEQNWSGHLKNWVDTAAMREVYDYDPADDGPEVELIRRLQCFAGS